MDSGKTAKTAKSAAAGQRWFSGWRRAPRPHQPDFADMGTAFGLDLSLDQMLADALLPAPPPAVKRKGWVQRLAQRRSVG